MAEWYERFFAKKARRFICVSRAMKDDLYKNWNIKPQVCYDKANLDVFKPFDQGEKNAFFNKMGMGESIE